MAGKLIEVRAVRIICDVVLRERVLTELERHWEPPVIRPGLSTGTERCARLVGGTRSLPPIAFMSKFGAEMLAERIIEYCESSKFDGIGLIAGVHPLWIHEDEAANLHDA